MKLKRLWINGFKNLNNFELDFTDKEGVTVLIGNNGSGKSNVLEAISIIFIELQKKEYSYQFDYEIEYKINDENLKIKQNNEELLFYIEDEIVDILKRDKLPYKVIASYNGAVDRLRKIYRDSHFDVKRKKITTERNSILYVDLDKLDIYKLMSVYSEIYDVYIESNTTEKEILTEKYVDLNIAIEIRSYDKELVKNENLIIFLDAISTENIITFDSLVAYFNSTLPNTKQDFLNYLFNCKFRTLVNEFKNEEQSLLSEGEQHLKLLELVLNILAEQNTLILLDEPDSHIHVGNKQKITEFLKKLDNIDNEVILTTHSPSLTHSFDDKHIAMIANGKIEDKTKQEIFSHITEGIWNYQEQSIFLSSQKDIILLVEGKHDKIHIEEAFRRLKDEYRELNFDVFSTDGASNLKQLVVGFSTSDYNFSDKKIIAIFDDDTEGRQGMSNKNFDIDRNNPIAKLKSNSKFYGFLLPKRENFTKECTIENMYDSEKYKNALNEVFNRRVAHQDFFENKSIDTISSKIKEDAKNQLANNCKEFDNSDFHHFKKIFDLIRNIKSL